MDGSGTLFADFLAALGDRVRPLVISYPAGQQLGYAALAALVRPQLPTTEPYYLLGESFSGPVAIALAAERPPLLAGLILTCTFARNPVPGMRALRHLVRFAPLSGKLAALASPLLLGFGAPAKLRRALGAALANAPAALMRLRLREVLEVDYSEQARQVAVPVLYLQAAQDRIVFASPARHLQSLWPALQVVTLRGPHLLLQATPVEAAAVLAVFFDE